MSRTVTTLTTTIVFSSRLSRALLPLRLTHVRRTTSPSSLHPPRQPKTYSTMAATRTYHDALTLLSTLQPNKAITSLFSSPPPPSSSSSSPPTSKPNLNAQAIPEMLLWLQRAGYSPSDLARLKTIHVAGTKGKGSVSALATSILVRYPTVAGRVGTYTSPHVVSVRERIMLDGEPIAPELFARYFFELWDRFGASAAAEGRKGAGEVAPFYFRFLTILAWHVFLSEGVRSAVVECGIGGEYDATNVVPGEAVTAAVVTQLGIDHVAMLGRTAEEIAWHKAGVFKGGVKAFTRRLEGQGKEGVMKVLRDRAAEKGATLVEIPDGMVEGWDGVDGARLRGEFQKNNMALAVAAAREHLLRLGQGFEAPFARDDYQLRDMPAEFYEGLKTASLRGRCELITDVEAGVEWYLDGAHTDESLEAAGRWFGRAAGGENAARILVFNQQERDAPHLLTVLLKAAGGGSVFDMAVFCRNEEDEPAEGEARDLSMQEANARVLGGWDTGDKKVAVRTESAVRPALKAVLEAAGENRRAGITTRVLVTGSFHLVGAVIKNIEQVEE